MKINQEQLNFISDMKENHNINHQKTLNQPKIINNEILKEQYIKTINSYQSKDYQNIYDINYINMNNNHYVATIGTNNYMNHQNGINNKYGNEINYFLNDGIYK